MMGIAVVTVILAVVVMNNKISNIKQIEKKRIKLIIIITILVAICLWLSSWVLPRTRRVTALIFRALSIGWSSCDATSDPRIGDSESSMTMATLSKLVVIICTYTNFYLLTVFIFISTFNQKSMTWHNRGRRCGGASRNVWWLFVNISFV